MNRAFVVSYAHIAQYQNVDSSHFRFLCSSAHMSAAPILATVSGMKWIGTVFKARSWPRTAVVEIS